MTGFAGDNINGGVMIYIIYGIWWWWCVVVVDIRDVECAHFC